MFFVGDGFLRKVFERRFLGDGFCGGQFLGF